MEKLYTRVKKQKKDTVVSYLERNFTSYGFVRTFHDKGCVRSECAEGRQRSLDALYQVALSKFPRLTVNSFYKSMIKFIRKSRNSRTRYALLFCPSANRWVMHSIGDTDHNLYHNNIVYDYSNSKNKLSMQGSGQLRAKELIDIMNATT